MLSEDAFHELLRIAGEGRLADFVSFSEQYSKSPGAFLILVGRPDIDGMTPLGRVLEKFSTKNMAMTPLERVAENIRFHDDQDFFTPVEEEALNYFQNLPQHPLFAMQNTQIQDALLETLRHPDIPVANILTATLMINPAPQAQPVLFVINNTPYTMSLETKKEYFRKLEECLTPENLALTQAVIPEDFLKFLNLANLQLANFGRLSGLTRVLNKDVIAKICCNFMYYKSIVDKVNLLKRYKTAACIAELIKETVADERLNEIVKWYILSYYVSDKIAPIKKCGKRPHEIITDYLLLLKASKNPIYAQWVSAIHNELPKFNFSDSDYKSSVFAIFFEESELPKDDILLGDFSDSDEDNKKILPKKRKKKKNKKKKTGCEEKASITDSTSEIQEEKNSIMDDSSEAYEEEQAILEDYAEEKIVAVSKQEDFPFFLQALENSSKVDDVFSAFFKVALALSQQSSKKSKVGRFMREAYKLGMRDFLPTIDEILIRPGILSEENLHEHWNRSIKLLLIKTERYFMGESSSAKKKALRKIVNSAISNVSCDLSHIRDVWVIYEKLTALLSSYYCAANIYLMGSVAAGCVYQAFHHDTPGEWSDIDLAIVVDTVKAHTFWESLIDALIHSEGYSVLSKRLAPHHASYLASLTIKYREIEYDMTFYPRIANEEVPRFRRVDSYKSAVIELETLQLFFTYKNTMLLINKKRSFDVDQLNTVIYLSYIIRELAKMRKATMTLEAEFDKAIKHFFSDPESQAIIKKAVGYCFTKYITRLPSSCYEFLAEQGWLKHVIPVEHVARSTRAIQDICNITEEILKQHDNSIKGKNILPVIYLSACCIYAACAEKNRLSECYKKIRTLPFPQAIKEEASNCIHGFFSRPIRNPLSQEIYKAMYGENPSNSVDFQDIKEKILAWR